MKKYGVIFDSSWLEKTVKERPSSSRRGVVCRAGVPPPSWGKKASFFDSRSIRWLGNGLILISFLGLFLIFAPVLKVEFSYRVRQIYKTLVGHPRSYFGELLQSPSPSQTLAAPNASFSIVIPKINASARVFPNVDASNQTEYSQVLTQGVAHAKGTVFPGMEGTIYLFAHSTDSFLNITRYNAVFYLLRELEPEDEIFVFFQGKKFTYKVFEKRVVSASDTSFFKSGKDELLVLQTCWPPGTTLKRLLILAKPAVYPLTKRGLFAKLKTT